MQETFEQTAALVARAKKRKPVSTGQKKAGRPSALKTLTNPKVRLSDKDRQRISKLGFHDAEAISVFENAGLRADYGDDLYYLYARAVTTRQTAQNDYLSYFVAYKRSFPELYPVLQKKLISAGVSNADIKKIDKLVDRKIMLDEQRFNEQYEKRHAKREETPNGATSYLSNTSTRFESDELEQNSATQPQKSENV